MYKASGNTYWGCQRILLENIVYIKIKKAETLVTLHLKKNIGIVSLNRKLFVFDMKLEMLCKPHISPCFSTIYNIVILLIVFTELFVRQENIIMVSLIKDLSG